MGYASEAVEAKRVTEAEWLACEWPFEMLCHLDGKASEESFILFSIACCRRVFSLFTDPRSRAVVEATEAAVSGAATWESVGPVYDIWHHAYLNDEVKDGAAGSTNEAVVSICGLGYGHAAQVSKSCLQAAGYAASMLRCSNNDPQEKIASIWRNAEADERYAQCQLLRQIFGYLPTD